MIRAALRYTILLAGLSLGPAFVPGAFAFNPRPDQMPRVEQVARELETATRRLADQAWEARARDRAIDEAALRRIGELQQRASWFRRQVEANGDRPELTRDDFDQLVTAYVAASSALNQRYPRRGIPADFATVERLMDELTDQYGGQERYWGRYGNDRPTNASLREGSVVTVRLTAAIRSRDLVNGQRLDAVLAQDVSAYGRTVGNAGDAATLTVLELDKAGRVSGRERLTLALSDLRLDGRWYPIESEPVTFVAESSTRRDVGTVGAGTAIGALIGAITDGGDGAAKGAAIGAAGGTGVVLSTRGKSVHLERGQQIDFSLRETVRIRMRDPRPERAPEHPYRPGDVSRRR